MIASTFGAGYGGTASAQSASAIQPHWVGSWGASPAFPNGPEVVKQTIRQVVRLSLGGRAVRIRLSNEMGTSPLVIGSAHIARPGQEPGSIDPATDHVLTFSGRPSIIVPVGAPVLSDPVNLDAKSLDSLSISLYVPRATGPTATHPSGAATAYISDGGDATAAATLPNPSTSTARFFLSGVDVDEPDAGAVVALGDSITDGFGSAVDANHRWPDVLAERLVAAHLSLGVVDAGIGGNRILHDLPRAEFGPAALARFDRDVLSVPGVRTVILLESINDIGLSGSAGLSEQAVTADDITAGMRQIVERAHAHGITVLGATLTPFADTIGPGYYSKEGEEKRQAVNRWIREGDAFDGVIDFDAVLRDPVHTDHIAAQYDGGDHLHPNDAGYRRMGEAVDLALLRKKSPKGTWQWCASPSRTTFRPYLSALTHSTPFAPCWRPAAKQSRPPIGSFTMETGDTPRLAVMGGNRISMDHSS
jgi:lysophospholipase L1-like esterase